VLVGCGGHTFALPARNVERLCRVRMEEIEAADGGEAVRIGGQAVPLARLADLLEIPAPRADASSEAAGDNGRAALPAAVLLAGERRLGVIVDAFLDERETVVKELGLAPSAMGLATGGVPLEDGTVAVLLNVSAVFERFRSKRGAPGLKAAETPARKRSRVLVVDDSITTRSLERSILEAHGYEVRVAVDGVEALAKLRAEQSDLVIADVRMPRMDGFELLEHMKRDPELARIPVIVVTSLESREDQERGLSLGADAYIVKRKFDQRELLNTVRQIL
jgi:two-component system chemotaxis sensor kinase CheA